ncbi:hypothetical protein PFISCL1PPCAC_25905, partial [Pristionchus fissidentatus]
STGEVEKTYRAAFPHSEDGIRQFLSRNGHEHVLSIFHVCFRKEVRISGHVDRPAHYVAYIGAPDDYQPHYDFKPFKPKQEFRDAANSEEIYTEAVEELSHKKSEKLREKPKPSLSSIDNLLSSDPSSIDEEAFTRDDDEDDEEPDEQVAAVPNPAFDSSPYYTAINLSKVSSELQSTDFPTMFRSCKAGMKLIDLIDEGVDVSMCSKHRCFLVRFLCAILMRMSKKRYYPSSDEMQFILLKFMEISKTELNMV